MKKIIGLLIMFLLLAVCVAAQGEREIKIAGFSPSPMEKYNPGQEVEFKLKATENFDDGIASYNDGFNIQFYTFDATEYTEDQMFYGAGVPGDYIPMDIVKGYNANFISPYWTSTFTVPQKPGTYYTLFILYCSRANSTCDTDTFLKSSYSNNYPYSKHLIKYEVGEGTANRNYACDGETATLNAGETKTYRVHQTEYEINAEKFQGNFKLKVNGETTGWMYIGTEEMMADGMKVKVTDMGSDDITLCLTPGPATSTCREAVLREGEQHHYRIGNDKYSISAFFVDTDTDRPKIKIKANGQISQTLSPGETYYFGEGSIRIEAKILKIKRDGGKYIVTYCIESNRLIMSDDIPEQVAESSQPEENIDLSNYPDLFIKGNSLNTVFVVGDQAPADDVIAAIDISVSFQKHKVIKTGGAMLSSEVGHYKRNIISVGRPCDNAVTAQILRMNGISDYDFDCSYGLKPQQAIVYLFDYHGYAHMLVFGYSRLETRQMARTLSMQKMSGRRQLFGFHEDVMPQPEEPELVEPEPVREMPECQKKLEQFKRDLIEKYDSKNIPIPEELMEKYDEMHRSCMGTPEPQITEDRDKDCPGCRKNGACMQIGIRLLENDEPVYCDIDSAFKPQRENDKVCMNNYECLSNTCQDGTCQSMGEQIKGIQRELEEQKGILEKIMGFFKRMFSFR